MSPKPSHATPSGRAYLAVQRLARTTGRATEELLQLYALEGFLVRLAASQYRDRLVLKGGVLLAAFDARRPTRDIDLHAHGVSNELDDARGLVAEIADLEADDGLLFDPAGCTAKPIRDEEDYNGVRVSLRGRLDRARIASHIDLNVGDPVRPPAKPVTVPRLLGGDPITVVGYPLPMVIAEKLVTAVQRSRTNTRWRDYADMHELTRHHDLTANELRIAVHTVAEHRATELLPLAELVEGYAARAQDKWQRWRALQEAEHLPKEFGQVLERVIAFADPLLGEKLPEGAVWRAATQRWEPERVGA